MKISVLYLNILLSILLTMTSCAPVQSDNSIKISSFREYYPALLREAQNWRSDAYLTDARIFVFPSAYDSNIISASFQSPSENLTSLAIEIDEDGNMTSKVFIQHFPVLQQEPIKNTDWKLDSQEALETMLRKADQQTFTINRLACSYIKLERIWPIPNQPVTWSLALWDCTDALQYLYLDASSGEMLDSSAVNIKPTRFPTAIP